MLLEHLNKILIEQTRLQFFLSRFCNMIVVKILYVWKNGLFKHVTILYIFLHFFTLLYFLKNWKLLFKQKIWRLGDLKNIGVVWYEILSKNFQFLNNITRIFTLFLSTRIFKKYKYYKNNVTKRAHSYCKIWQGNMF